MSYSIGRLRTGFGGWQNGASAPGTKGTDRNYIGSDRDGNSHVDTIRRKLKLASGAI